MRRNQADKEFIVSIVSPWPIGIQSLQPPQWYNEASLYSFLWGFLAFHFILEYPMAQQ